MDIDRHMRDAASPARSAASPRRVHASGGPRSPRKSPLTSHFTASQHHVNSSAEDVSTTSDSGNEERDYQTDFTTPESSDACLDDMQPDDVEDFRDREYPQLKGKTYLDHGGTTVCADCVASRDLSALLTVGAALRQVFDRGLLCGPDCQSLWQSSLSIDSLRHCRSPGRYYTGAHSSILQC